MKTPASVTDLAVFEERHIRRAYDKKTETWYFSVVDIVAALTEQADFQKARKYWNKLKERLAQEGSQPVTNCHRLKLRAEGVKQRLTDVANAETLLRLVQSVPSPKAEPIKLRLYTKDGGNPVFRTFSDTFAIQFFHLNSTVL